jgi:cysteine desulfurase / selenocysteine lyase
MRPTPLYLDNAATSFPKPPGVYEAMLAYGTGVGASPGRGQYAASREGARLIRECRERLARLINADDPASIVFTLNTTDALNIAIKGVARQRRLERPGAPVRMVTTAMDHNSVLRPLHALTDECIEVVRVGADPATGRVDPRAVAEAIDDWTALVAVNMVSNVGGTIQPIDEIARACRGRGVPLLADGAQALGHIPVDVRGLGIDLLAFPGHKGLLGPQGTGGLYIAPGVAERLATTREGGTGSWSESDAHPVAMPERFEAGSHNTIGLVGLSAAVAWMLERGVESLRAHEEGLIRCMLEGLRGGGCRHAHWPAAGDGPLSSFRLLGPTAVGERVAVFGLVHDTLSPAEVAAVLESDYGVQARAGLSCAPGAHEVFGTTAGGGAVRVSFGPFVSEEGVRRAIEALAGVQAGARAPALT